MVWYSKVWYGRVLRGQMGAYDTDNGSACWLALRMWPKKLACYATALMQPGHTLTAPMISSHTLAALMQPGHTLTAPMISSHTLAALMQPGHTLTAPMHYAAIPM